LSFVLNEELPRFYGRRKGRRVSQAGILALKEGSKYIVERENFFETFFIDKKKIILEIGFGDGENLINSAKTNPNTFYLGADPFLNTTVKCIKQILANNLKNITIWPDDVRKIIKFFPLRSISEIKLLFPDPWPKAKHKRRRLIQDDFINNISRILKTKGTVTVGTDHKILKSWVLEKFLASSNFEWQVKSSKDWKTRPNECFLTKYEQKSLKEKRKPSWFVFEKKQ
jgi:tRNA (guanine-N7-)-methyltransferase